MTEKEQTSRLMQEVSEYVSRELGMKLENYEVHIVQQEQDALGVVYFPRKVGEDIVFISCKDTSKGFQMGTVTGSFYAINKVFRKLGIVMPTKSKQA
jgi:uncharacterized protein (DUF2164 family)